MRFFSSIAVVSLILLLMAGTGIRTLITLRFYINQQKIAATKCENKAKPELKCNGKCYLAKQLKESENNNETSAPASPERYQFPEISFLEHSCSFKLSSKENEHRSGSFFKNQKYSSLSGTILKPPPEFC